MRLKEGRGCRGKVNNLKTMDLELKNKVLWQMLAEVLRTLPIGFGPVSQQVMGDGDRLEDGIWWL